ncbi:MAG: sce7726 family protein [Clostridia bacterium]|nr:sce7726 family protein [Clostridia bacterium]
MLYDRDIREPLFQFLENQYGKIRILEEKRTGRARADIVMVTEDSIQGIEIKSDADSYARLAGQVKWYDQYYDANTVVIGTSHVRHIEEHVPEWWGIITVEETEGTIDFYLARKPKSNPKMDDRLNLGILWRPELVLIQEMNDMPKYREKSKAFVIEKILNMVPTKTLKRQMSEVLFERDYTTIRDEINEYRKEHGKRPRRKKRAKRKSRL